MLKHETDPRDRLTLNPLYAAVAAVVGTTFIPTAALAQEEEATATESEDAVDLTKIQVTGSRLTRAAIEGALPVSVINRADIETSGFSSVGELLRNTTFNSQGAFRAQSGSSAQSLVAVDLRGLGSERTLVLIDGRRAPKAPFAPTAQDLNAVPIAAVERIEILKDGASAIYGSDAIGGVINIITRKDFEGVEISYQSQSTDLKGGDVESGSVSIGINSDRGNAVFGASFFRRNIIIARDALFSTPGASFFSNNLIFGVDEDGDGATDGYTYEPVPGGCPNSNPDFYITPSGLCGFDFNQVAADEAETANQGIFAIGTYSINDDWQVRVDGSINRATSFGRYAPSLNDVALTVPLDNAYLDLESAGYDTDTITTPVYLYHRFAALGNRNTDTDANVYDISGVFSGTIGSANINVGARYNLYKFYEIGRNFVVLPIVQSYLDTDTYDFTEPGNNDDAVLNSMKATIGRVSTWKTREAFGDVSMPIFGMAGGDAMVDVGFEYREAEFNDQYDSLSEGGAIGGSAGNSAGINRDVTAFFAEALFPVLENLEVTAALRFDDYSDYGSDTSPKLSVRYQPIDPLTIRASYGQGFRAPSLDLISQKPAFSAESITNDQPTCEFFAYTWDPVSNVCRAADGEVQSIQINATSISNPDLASEQSDQFSLGFAYDVASFFDFSLDYYNIEVTDVIDQFQPEEIIDAIRIGDPVPEAFVITRGNNNDPNGRIVGLVFGYDNSSKLETDGLDFEANLRFNLGSYGNITSQARYVHILNYAFDGGRNEVGDPGVPEYRATASTTWNVWDISAGWNMNIIGDQAEALGQDADGSVTRSGHTPTYVTHDLQLSYFTPWKGQLSIGAINVLNKKPDQRSGGADPNGRPFNYYLYDQYGTQPYVRYTQRF